MTATIALTGATGFIGSCLRPLLKCEGMRLRLLSRRGGAASDGVDIVHGSLDDRDALERLVEGADLVVHLAGIVQAARSSSFKTVNVEATERLARLAEAAGCRHFLLVSSLAATRPEASGYAASKRDGEDAARAALSGTGLDILRPPAVYGPGDRVTLPIFQQLGRGFLAFPRGGMRRFSLIHVHDLAALIAHMAAGPVAGRVLSVDDGTPGGYGWRDLADAGSVIEGRPIRLVELPRGVMASAAALCDLLANVMGRPMPLSRDKLGELYQPDWLVGKNAVAPLGWRPTRNFMAGARETMSWYRTAGWVH